MEFLQSYWIWVLLGIGVVWLLARRGGHGMGCGMGGHGGHGSAGEEERPAGEAPSREAGAQRGTHAGHTPDRRGDGGTGRRRRHGCC